MISEHWVIDTQSGRFKRPLNDTTTTPGERAVVVVGTPDPHLERYDDKVSTGRRRAKAVELTEADRRHLPVIPPDEPGSVRCVLRDGLVLRRYKDGETFNGNAYVECVPELEMVVQGDVFRREHAADARLAPDEAVVTILGDAPDPRAERYSAGQPTRRRATTAKEKAAHDRDGIARLRSATAPELRGLVSAVGLLSAAGKPGFSATEIAEAERAVWSCTTR